MYFPVLTLGPGRRVGIWTVGCPHNCIGCISPDLRNLDNGSDVSVTELLGIIRSLPEVPDGFTVSGGEPFAQQDELAVLLSELSLISDDIIVFTGYTYEQLLERNNPSIDSALSFCSMLVDGQYLEEHNDGVGMRGSNNQRFLRFKHEEIYADAEIWPRAVQGVKYGDSFLHIGIP